MKVCGVAVAMLSGSRRAPPSSIDFMVNVGTVRGRPPRRAAARLVGRSVADRRPWVGRRSRSSPSTREACTWRRGPASRQGGDWNTWRVAGEHRRIGARAVSGGATSTGDSGQAAPLGRPRPTAGLVERPLPGNGHGGCGRRLGETHRWKHRQGAPGRPHGFELELNTGQPMRFGRPTAGRTGLSPTGAPSTSDP